MKFKTVLVTLLAAIFMHGASAQAPSSTNKPTASVPASLYQNPKAPPEARVEDLLKQLTLPEKLSLLWLEAPDALRLNTQPIPRLGVPSVRTCDAPQGVRDGQSTTFPLGVVMASTWNPTLIRLVGAAIGQEAKAKNRQIIYGPDLNIQRTPQGGRNGEEFSEDPYLAAQMGAAYVTGMQSQGTASCPKHFLCNDQEYHRHDVNIQVDERTLHEIYLPPFDAALRKAHAWSVMSSFNQINGVFMAQNPALLNGLLKTEWHWDGLVVSDWGALHDTVAGANAGNDIEMPHPQFFSPAALTDALQKNQVTQAVIDDKVRRLLRLMVRTGLLDGPQTLNSTLINSPALQKLALKVAQQGIILLKNAGNILPLDRKRIKSIAVIGPNAQDTQVEGRWSADVTPVYRVSILDGIRKAAGTGITVDFAQGCPRTGGSSPADMDAAAALAAKSDVAVVVVGTDNNYEGEELDIPNLSLPGDQDALIQKIAAANKNTIVVLNQGTPIDMSKWLAQVPGLLEPWYSGQEQGNAVAGILFGDVNPSGKLTQTIAVRREDYSDFGNYPGTNNVITYGEGIYVGYRHFDKAKIAPLFPFGFGLSYTTFAYSGLQTSPVFKRGGVMPVHLTVQNTGHRAGDEIVQMYIHPLNPKEDRPLQELKGFGRVSLSPGAKTVVTIPLDDNAFAYWDTTHHRWHSDSGRYEIDLGSSSRDIRLRAVVRLP